MTSTIPPSVSEPATAVLNSGHYIAECTVIGLAILSAVIVGSIAGLFVQCIHMSVNRLRNRNASRKKHRPAGGKTPLPNTLLKEGEDL